MATSEEGRAVVKRGRKWIISMVRATRPTSMYNWAPSSQATSTMLPSMKVPASQPGSPSTPNWLSWARKITMARPLTKPSITGCGTMRMNLPSLNKPALICRIPISTTVANRYSTPWSATSVTITTASAPVAPEIMPGRPPMQAVIRPTMKAAYRPTSGSTPATKAKATASGTRARATVRPDSTSFLTVAALLG